jgi:hypothetical protein
MQPHLAKLFCEWLPLWLHHKILKRNPAPATLQETHPKPNSGRLDVEKLTSYSRLTPVHCVHWPDIICIMMDHPSDVHHDECGWICSTNYEGTNYLPWFPCKIHLKSWEIPAKLYKHNIFK